MRDSSSTWRVQLRDLMPPRDVESGERPVHRVVDAAGERLALALARDGARPGALRAACSPSCRSRSRRPSSTPAWRSPRAARACSSSRAPHLLPTVCSAERSARRVLFHVLASRRRGACGAPWPSPSSCDLLLGCHFVFSFHFPLAPSGRPGVGPGASSPCGQLGLEGHRAGLEGAERALARPRSLRDSRPWRPAPRPVWASATTLHELGDVAGAGASASSRLRRPAREQAARRSARPPRGRAGRVLGLGPVAPACGGPRRDADQARQHLARDPARPLRTLSSRAWANVRFVISAPSR